MNDGLAGHWKLQGDVRDYSGNGNDGRTESADAAHGRFDGNGEFIEVADSDSLKIGTGDFTVCAKICIDPKVESSPGDILGKFDDGERRGFTLSVGTSSGGYNSQGTARQVRFGIDDGGIAQWEDCGRPNPTSNYVGSLTVFDGGLYVGTNEGHGESDWCHVYQYKEDAQWLDCGRLGDRRTHGVEAMVVHEGVLYAGSSNYDRGGDVSSTGLDHGRIYRYKDGEKWEDCGQPGQCGRLPSLASYKGRLYVLGTNDESTPDHRSRCFVYEGNGNWKPCGDWITNVHCMLVHDGKLHVGGNGAKYYPDAWMDGFPGAEIHTFDGESWSSLGNPLGSWEKCNQVHTLGVHRGDLVAGTWPYPMAICRKGRWDRGGSLGDSIETNDLEVYNGKLYAGTIPRGDLWRYERGQTWTLMKRFFSPDGWEPVVKRQSQGDYREIKKAWTRVTSLTVYGGRLFASIGSCTGSTKHAPADVRGRVFSLLAGRCATFDRDPGHEWQHWIAVKDGGRLKLYRSGKLVAESSSFQPGAYNLSNEAPLRIGHGESGHFCGRLCDVRIYRRALGSEEINTLAGV